VGGQWGKKNWNVPYLGDLGGLILIGPMLSSHWIKLGYRPPVLMC
jgi:hypothetical protein